MKIEKYIARTARLLLVFIITLISLPSKGQILTHINNVNITETNGRESFANKSVALFEAESIDQNLLKYSKASRQTKEAEVEIFRLNQPANFFQMFSFFGCNDLNSLFLTQSQIITFCRDNKHWFDSINEMTFFLTRSSGGPADEQVYFVIGIYRSKEKTYITMDDIGRNSFWNNFSGGVRLVVRTDAYKR